MRRGYAAVAGVGLLFTLSGCDTFRGIMGQDTSYVPDTDAKHVTIVQTNNKDPKHPVRYCLTKFPGITDETAQIITAVDLTEDLQPGDARAEFGTKTVMAPSGGEATPTSPNVGNKELMRTADLIDQAGQQCTAVVKSRGFDILRGRAPTTPPPSSQNRGPVEVARLETIG